MAPSKDEKTSKLFPVHKNLLLKVCLSAGDMASCKCVSCLIIKPLQWQIKGEEIIPYSGRLILYYRSLFHFLRQKLNSFLLI